MAKKPRQNKERGSKPRKESMRPATGEPSSYSEFKKTYVPKKSGGRGGKFSGGSRGSKFGGRSSGGSKFGGRSPRGSKFSGGSKFGGRGEKYDAVCSKCGEDCQVPFKPTNTKPIYCDNCYSQDGPSDKGFTESNKGFTESNKGFTEINNRLEYLEKKIDKILELLDD